MNIRVITLRYDSSLGGFPEQPLQQALASGEVLEVREYFFTHDGTPHLTLVLVMNRAGAGQYQAATRSDSKKWEDPGDDLPAHLRPLYQTLRDWRNAQGKQNKVPSYVIMRNLQLAEICRLLPRSLEALRQIQGIGQATVKKYGQEILSLIPPDLQAEPLHSEPNRPPASEEEPT
ncbi:MAG: HRDC domain-containing protein [Pirellulaceae bacterium]|nr:HRDC domain-containing protein [Pirellulaceae bacterium]